MTRQYYGVENLGMTAEQQATLAAALRQLGANTHPNPSRRNHTRTRQDGLAIIFEGQFEDSDWTVDSAINRLSNIYGVDPASISASVTQTAYGPVVTFSFPLMTDRFRMIAFGGLLAIWQQSHAAAKQYLNDNLQDWS